jgi:hypothetical protein
LGSDEVNSTVPHRLEETAPVSVLPRWLCQGGRTKRLGAGLIQPDIGADKSFGISP